MVNRKRFYDQFREQFGKLKQPQVDGTNAILNACNEYEMPDMRFHAYILATAWHETGTRMEPVRETFAKTDEQAVERLMRTSYGKRYARRMPNGHAYYGRGFVQLTWMENYRKMGQSLNINLEDNPDRALEPDTAARILVEGMMLGSFTGKKLADYFTDTKSDTVNARRIVNGLDRAHKIATYGRKFYACLLPPPM